MVFMKFYNVKLFTFLSCILLIFLITSCAIQKSTFKFNTKNMKVALVLPGPVNNSSRNLAAYNGLKRFLEDYQAEIAVVEKVSLSESRKIFSSLAERKFDLIIGQGFEYGFVVKKIAKMFPDTFFCIIGGDVSQEPNLCSFNFKDEQYGYLVGIVAGLNTTTNKIGIVIGKKSPAEEKVVIGIRKGLKAVNPKADLIVSFINTIEDISKGREAAIDQINEGVDVVTYLADTAGIGVIKAAEDSDISAIGSVIDQHDMAPTTVITSGIQDTSQLIYLACEYYSEEILESRIYRFGLKNQVVELAPSYGNIDPTTETRINRIKTKLTEQEAPEVQQNTKQKDKK